MAVKLCVCPWCGIPKNMEHGRRRPARGDDLWHEVFLNEEEAAAAPSLAQSIADGHSILVLHQVAPVSLCDAVAAEASAAATKERSARCLAGLVRMPVVDLVSERCAALCDSLLLNQLERIDDAAPSLLSSLFDSILDTPRTTAFGNASLGWSEGEPALNIYTPGGCFTPHEDEQSLTCLLNVSSPTNFSGGGTAFWSQKLAGEGHSDAERNPPMCLITPPIGTALIFGGQVTHAAQPLLTGERIVFVASFSPAIEPRDTVTAAPEECSLAELCAALTGEQPPSSCAQPSSPRPSFV